MHADRPSRMDIDRERSLVAASRSDPTAFGRLYDFYAPRIVGFIYRRVRDYDVAEDLTSLTFQRAFENVRRASFRDQSFGGWLYRVASNAVVDHYRQDGRTISLASLLDGDDFDYAGVDILADALDRDEISRGLYAVHEMHREVLILRYFDDLDADEMCVILGCSKSTLSGKLQRALRALRAAIVKGAADVA
jgi:RNA polymerase sigma-70 factor, ECF subfamily